ncbi:hypothetical protein HHI36_006101 [Cryptolaemus montrouzieri]|uniref:MYND-type domain-containing protein n=1 Tax=Cryptolaemus montrouzieri TaxID=559131 RepID=A0ABD2NW02_9CUCU
MDWLMELDATEAVRYRLHLFIRSQQYYGNSCTRCFLSKPLKKCASCKVVSYCSRKHQVEDWKLHKLDCSALKNLSRRFSNVRHKSFESFSEYRDTLAMELKRFHKREMLTEYERSICELPWVCSVCYSKDSLNFECEKCKAVVYCSLEHKQDDEGHKAECQRLEFSRIFDSFPYENGFKWERTDFVFEKVPTHIQFLPKDMDELSCLIQKQIKSPKGIHEMISYYIHNDFYSVSATILYALERIGLIDRRVFTRKPSMTEEERRDRLADRVVNNMLYSMGNIKTLKMEPAMIIHFVAVDEYEVTLNWITFVGLFTHWLLNIDYPKLIFIGPALKYCDEPDFDALTIRSGYQCYKRAYKDIVNSLEKPDMVILLDYRNGKKDFDEFDDTSSRRALFKHKGVPLIVTASKQDQLEHFVNKQSDLSYVEVLADVHKNPFADSRPRRIWDEKCLSTCVKNDYIAILTRN